MGKISFCLALTCAFNVHASHVTSIASGPWSEPSTWQGGAPPLDGDDVTVLDAVTFDLCDESLIYGEVTIEEGASLSFSTFFDRCLLLRGNLIVRGALNMQPARPEAHARITFVDVDEGAFIGGGMSVLASDVGLWVVGDGQLNAVGSEKTPWTRLIGSASMGTQTLQVVDATGWVPGDRIIVTPTDDTETPESEYDDAIIASVDGNAVTLVNPLGRSHPMVDGSFTAEVLNLSRNVIIEGQPLHRAHVIFLMSTVPQFVSMTEIRHMGPTQPNAQGEPVSVLGRYGMHFHHGGDGTRGSLIRGVVAHDIGAHAFVPHMSHGIAMQECISHDTREEAFWWDAPTSSVDSFSDDIVYLDSVASMVKPNDSAVRLAGFNFMKGDGNVAVGCVAVGVAGGPDSAGFSWPEGIDSVWTFNDNVAHSNDEDGVFVWQNNSGRHTIEQSVLYRNAKNGIEHGAYKNDYLYRDLILFGNRVNGIEIHAVSGLQQPLIFENILIDGDDVGSNGIFVNRHNQIIAPAVTIIRDVEIKRITNAAIRFGYGGPLSQTQVERMAIVRPIFGMPESQWVSMSDDIWPSSLAVLDLEDCAIEARPMSSGIGVITPDWNARTVELGQWSPPVPLGLTVVDAFGGIGWADWSIVGTAQTFAIVAGQGEVRYGAGVGPSRALHADAGLPIDSSQVVTLRASHTTSGMEAGIVARYTSEHSFRAVLYSSSAGQVLRVVQIDDDVQSVLGQTPVGQWSADVQYRVRFDVAQLDRLTSILKAKLWPLDAAEPETFDLVIENAEPSLQSAPGALGIFARTASSSSRYWRFDDYSATR